MMKQRPWWCTQASNLGLQNQSFSVYIITLNGCKRPMQICTRRLWPSETLCIRHWRLISRRSINFSLLTGSIPSTAWQNNHKTYIPKYNKHKKRQFHQLLLISLGQRIPPPNIICCAEKSPWSGISP